MFSWIMTLSKLLFLWLINILNIENQKKCIKIFMLGFHVSACKKKSTAIITVVQWTQVVKLRSPYPKNLSNASKQFVGNSLQIAFVFDHFVWSGFTGLWWSSNFHSNFRVIALEKHVIQNISQMFFCFFPFMPFPVPLE